MNRFANALALDREDAPLGQLTGAIAAAQQEIFALKGGSDEVRKDPAVGLLVSRLAHATGAAQFVRSLADWSKAYELCEQGQSQASDHPDTRRLRDGVFSQSAVNVGALANSIGRYAGEMESRGMTPAQISADPAISLITYQIISLCRAEQKLDLSKPHEDRAACVAIAAAQAATESLSTKTVEPAPGIGLRAGR